MGFCCFSPSIAPFYIRLLVHILPHKLMHTFWTFPQTLEIFNWNFDRLRLIAKSRSQGSFQHRFYWWKSEKCGCLLSSAPDPGWDHIERNVYCSDAPPLPLQTYLAFSHALKLETSWTVSSRPADKPSSSRMSQVSLQAESPYQWVTHEESQWGCHDSSIHPEQRWRNKIVAKKFCNWRSVLFYF